MILKLAAVGEAMPADVKAWRALVNWASCARVTARSAFLFSWVFSSWLADFFFFFLGWTFVRSTASLQSCRY